MPEVTQLVGGRGRIWTRIWVTLECAPYLVFWPGLMGWTARLGFQRLPRAWRGWRNLCLAQTVPAQSWRFKWEGRQWDRGRPSRQLPHTGLAPWPGGTLPTFLPAVELCLPSWASVSGSRALQAWVRIPALPPSGYVTWGKWLPSLCLSFHFQNRPLRAST